MPKAEKPQSKQSTFGASNSKAQQSIEFETTRHMVELFGEHDVHLARIEDSFDVSLTPKGNAIFVRGDVYARQSATRVLNDLHHRLEQGLAVELSDVDGAIRMAKASEGAAMSSDQQYQIKTVKRLITPRSPNQAAYIKALQDSEMVFGLGPAGTGKTYLAVAMAVSMMLRGEVDRIVLSRPAVEAGERLGFLPGDLKEKVDPYLRPLYDALYDTLPGDKVARQLESGEIEVAPLAYMRGRTLANSFVILDEAQNSTEVQMKMFLTRMGENTRMVITGDPSQVDLPRNIPSGLSHAADILENVGDISFVRFNERDVVRHPLVSKIVRAYNLFEKDQRPR